MSDPPRLRCLIWCISNVFSKMRRLQLTSLTPSMDAHIVLASQYPSDLANSCLRNSRMSGPFLMTLPDRQSTRDFLGLTLRRIAFFGLQFISSFHESLTLAWNILHAHAAMADRAIS